MTANTLSSTPSKIATQYVRIWNESDPARRRILIEQTFTPQARYIDPLMQSAGHDALDAMIGAAQGQFSGLWFSVSGKADGHHDVVRFSWSLGAGDTEPVASGTDIAVVAADGRIDQLTGFLDKMPS
ncbi:nuclear transport factor 2 family protein [Pusillimonas sp. ANT_WB101]|uniref:nuclear transport factor 2 family protein n=1 Tax=Pusillimonas sp. ANT_WB101 TaxID=2597356 RepID=UPI0011EC90C6|nr:nuclear transport factor 2 family protein [Pusillimonas sp. ANT_WB101]KAA0892498.1 nuclear transport factor 2 family protein [Pusillimonas sp. ANT_WB101]